MDCLFNKNIPNSSEKKIIIPATGNYFMKKKNYFKQLKERHGLMVYLIFTLKSIQKSLQAILQRKNIKKL